MVERTPTPSVYPHCVHCGYKTWHRDWFRDGDSPYVLFLAQFAIWHCRRLPVPRKPRQASIRWLSYEVNGGTPGYRECTGAFVTFLPFLCFFLPSHPVLVLSLQWPGTCSGSILFSWTCWSGSHCPLSGADLQPWHLRRPCAPQVAPGWTYQPRTQSNHKTLTIKPYSQRPGVMTPQLKLEPATSLSGSKLEFPAANWNISHVRRPKYGKKYLWISYPMKRRAYYPHTKADNPQFGREIDVGDQMHPLWCCWWEYQLV